MRNIALASSFSTWVIVFFGAVFGRIPWVKRLAVPVEVRQIRRKHQAHERSEDRLSLQEKNFHLNVAVNLAFGSVSLRFPEAWFRSFVDHESLVSLHRFGWLDEGVKDHGWDGNVLQNLITSWGMAHAKGLNCEVLEAYSASERLINWIYHLQKFQLTEASVEANVAKIIRNEFRFLIANLEYKFFGQTGNHIINNARALIVCGSWFGNSEIIYLGRKIVESELPNLYTAASFLREGSLHYHVLVLIWLCEISLVLRKANQSSEKITGFILNGIEPVGALTYSEDGRRLLPPIGDLSPDLSPESSLIKLDQALKAAELPEISNWFNAIDSLVNTQFTPSFARLSQAKFDVFCRVDELMENPVCFHGHDDHGSISIYLDGEMVMGDLGQYSYSSTQLSRHMKSAAAHNTYQIDGSPFFYSRRNKFFLKRKSEQVRLSLDSDLSGLTLESSYGDSRVTRWQRLVDMNNDCIRVCDTIESGNPESIKTIFWFRCEIYSFNTVSNTLNLVLNGQRISADFKAFYNDLDGARLNCSVQIKR